MSNNKFSFYTPSDTNTIIQAGTTAVSASLGAIDDEFSKIVIINKGSSDVYYDFIEADLTTGTYSSVEEQVSPVLPSDYVEIIDWIELGEPATIYFKTASGTADVIIKRAQ